LAASEWSPPVNDGDRTLRGRVIVLESRSRSSASPFAQVQLYVELENYSSVMREPIQVYFDPAGLSFEVLDADGKSIPTSPTGGSGARIPPCSVVLPHDSSIRLRANPPGWGRGESQELVLPLLPWERQYWRLPPDREYHLVGKWKLAAPAETSADGRAAWNGELSFPKTRIQASAKRR
jgi:hypothetical protein